MYKAAKNEASRLKSRIEAQNVTIRTQQNEIKRLREALKAMVQVEENDVDMEATDAKEETEDTMSTSEHNIEYDDDGSSSADSTPIWDEHDGIFRCSSCKWEVIDGLCQVCNKCFDEYDDDAKSETEEELQCRSVATDNKLICSDRQLPPRGSTPLLDVDPSQLFPANIAHGYIGREEEYTALLGRGATRLMCELFDLEFTSERGIIAWADESIFEEFSGPAMEEGDCWKIHLGRRVRLPKGDIDGSVFVEELLEEALYFPAGCNTRWETVEEDVGVWVTRPNAQVFNKEDYDSDDSEAAFQLIDDPPIEAAVEAGGGDNEAKDTKEPGEVNGGKDDEDDDRDSQSDFASGYSIHISGQTTEAIRLDDYESDDYESDDYECDDCESNNCSDTDDATIDGMQPTIEAGVRDDAYCTESSSGSEEIESDGDDDEEED